MMNTKRETVERAIEDLEKNLGDLKKVQKELDSAFPRSRRSSDFIQRDMEDTMKDRMMQLFRERANIANTGFFEIILHLIQTTTTMIRTQLLFLTWGILQSRDAPGKQNRYPIIVGASTKSESRIDSTIRRVETFINQLKRKLRRRKDLQESNPFQLTESKLKQMILEAIKNK